ncbi:MAG: class I SAM-dependent methyltransferase [Novosphingobium sp.]
MTDGTTAMPGHGALMDSVYRGQRHIYDATRKFFLFGRDSLIEDLDCRPGQTILEIGCGTGRNLALIGRRWPGTQLHGLDISHEMLKSARAKLGERAILQFGDATAFDPVALFDRVVLSFALSMIPDWQAAIKCSAAALAPGGSLHIVDFGNLAGLLLPLRAALNAWLRHFHVSPRLELIGFCETIAGQMGWQCAVQRAPLDYYSRVTLIRPKV